jgi:prefoldin subunit 5
MTSVTDYVKTLADVESTLTRFQEMVSKYTFMQQNVERRAQGLKEKLPEMKRTLQVVKFLRRKRAKAMDDEPTEDDDSLGEEEGGGTDKIETTFSLQDTLYARATIRPATLDSVYLWLGANVMVSYPLTEAEELLQQKLDKAQESLKACDEDLEFLRVQITTLEVALARVHNWDVGEKRRLRAEGKLPIEGEKKGKEED